MLLLWVLSFASLRMRSASIFMSTLSDLIKNLTRALGVRLLFFYLIASVGANVYENVPSTAAFCDNSSMLLDVEFKEPFYGQLYTSGDSFVSTCSFQASPALNNTKLKLTLPFSSCTFDINVKSEDIISISSTILVQQHLTIKTVYDTSINVTCEVPLPIDTFRQMYYPNKTSTAGHLQTGSIRTPGMSSWIETRVGSDLFPDDSEFESELFLVVSIIEGGKNRDVSVQNCIAHDDQILTDETSLYQMSDFFGCPNASYPLSNFTVSNQTDGRGDLMAYTKLESLSLIAIDELFVTCGVVLCENSCQNMCDLYSSRTSHYIDGIVVKKFVGRNPGATIPTSLDNFERRQPLVISKRRGVLSDYFSSWVSAPASVNEVSEKQVNVSNETVWEQIEGDADVINLTFISTDLEIDTFTQDSVENFKIMFNNESTRLFNKFKAYNESRKVMDRFAVTLMVLIVISCYGGLLYWTKV